jgi:hypothetical protein
VTITMERVIETVTWNNAARMAGCQVRTRILSRQAA